jgi:hypothetical protein
MILLYTNLHSYVFATLISRMQHAHLINRQQAPITAAAKIMWVPVSQNQFGTHIHEYA